MQAWALNVQQSKPESTHRHIGTCRHASTDKHTVAPHLVASLLHLLDFVCRVVRQCDRFDPMPKLHAANTKTQAQIPRW
jgi:hypothetical protein